MNKLETNALRIIELMGKEINRSNIMDFRYIADYSNCRKLMPIVFECNRSNINSNVSIDINDVQVWIMQDDEYLIDPITYRSEESFIEAIQECVIKFLELKNG